MVSHKVVITCRNHGFSIGPIDIFKFGTVCSNFVPSAVTSVAVVSVAVAVVRLERARLQV